MTTWRRTLYAMWAAQSLTIIGFSLRVPFLPFFLEDLGAETFEEQALWAGFIIGGGAALMAITAPLWGMVADRRGRKAMVLRAMFAGSVTISLMALATSPWHLLGLRFVEGAMTGTVAATITLVAATVPKERLGYAMGLMQMAVFAGTSVGPMIGGFLADVLGYRATFLAAGGMLFTAGCIVLFFVSENFQRPEPRRDGDGGPPRQSTWAILAGASMAAMLLVLLVARIAQTAIQPLAPLYVGQLGAGLSSVSSLAGIAIGVMGITSAISAVILGRLADRIGKRNILLLSLLLTGVLYLPQMASQSPFQFILAMALFGVAMGGVFPTATALVAQLTPQDRRGIIYGFSNTAMALGAFIGPVGGSVLAAMINTRTALGALGVTMVLAAAWAWYAVPASIDQPRQSDDPDETGPR
jgi:MFS transporter, DHA1 family, multidrug resistance protein